MKKFIRIAIIFSVIASVSSLTACADILPKTLKGEVFERPQDRALTVAACKGQVKVIRNLIREGANVNAIGDDGITPLIWAVACQNKNGVKGLLEAGADPNNLNARGRSVMFTAPTFPSGEIVQMLIDHGGDVNAYDHKGPFTALDKAYFSLRENNYHEPYEVLLKNGADIAFRPPRLGGSTHLEVLVANRARFDLGIKYIKEGYTGDLEKLRRRARGRAVYLDENIIQKNELLALLGEKLGPVDFSEGAFPSEKDENGQIIVDEFGLLINK